MGKVQELLSNFTSGLLGAKMRGRYDTNVYKQGCRRLTNMVTIPQGGVTKRPGTKSIAVQKTTGEIVRLLPFVFSSSDSFIIEMGAGYFRFYKDGAPILLNGLPYEIRNTYTESQLFNVTYVQCMDILYLFHQAHHPKQLSRYSDTQWSFTDIPFEDGPYFDVNTSTITIDHDKQREVAGYKSNYLGVAGDGTTLVCTGVAISIGGAIQSVCNTSTDNITWVKSAMGGHHTYNSIRYLNNMFIAVGGQGIIKSSVNGTTAWTKRTSGISTTLQDVAWDGSYLYYVGNAGVIRTSTASFTSFTARTSGVTSKLNAIAYDGSAYLVVVGNAGVILRADRGLPATWTAMSSGVTTDLNDVYYDSARSLWCACGDGGVILTSSDGMNWTKQKSGVNINLNGVCSDGTKFIVVGDYGYILTSSDGVTWAIVGHNKETSLKAVTFVNPYYVAVGTQGLIATSSDGVTWTYRGLQTAIITASDDLFRAGRDEGRHIRLSCKGIWTWGKIITVIDETQALIDIRGRFYGSKETVIWQLGAFYTGNYPKCGAFFQERLFLANTPLQPQTIWGSCSGDFVNFAPSTFESQLMEKTINNNQKVVKAIKIASGDVVDSSSITYVLGSTEMNYIQWMRGQDGLIIGCTGTIFRLTGAENGGPLTPFSADCREQGAVGTHNIQPVKVGPSLIYVQTIAKNIRELIYSSDSNTMVSPSLTVQCDEITGPGIVDMAYQEEPYSIVWAIRADGVLIGFTCDQYNKIAAWHIHSSGTGFFESVACIPGVGYTEVWFVVNRDGTRYIEQLQPFDFGSDRNAIWFVDASTDGITGVEYTAEVQTMDLQPGGDTKRIQYAVATLHETRYAKIGRDATKCDVVPGLSDDALYSCTTKPISFPSGYDREAYIYICSDRPLPLTVLSIKTVWEDTQ